MLYFWPRQRKLKNKNLLLNGNGMLKGDLCKWENLRSFILTKKKLVKLTDKQACFVLFLFFVNIKLALQAGFKERE